MRGLLLRLARSLTSLLPVFNAARPRLELHPGDSLRVRLAVAVEAPRGQAKPYGKTDRSLRAVPLPARAAEVLDEHPPRLETRILFPASRGGPLALSPFRHRDWNPALRAAGLEHRSPYAMRHTFASFSIAAGVSLFELSRLMGTSPAMIDGTYGHMLPDALDRARSALDDFVAERGVEDEPAQSEP
jgi:integrase